MILDIVFLCVIAVFLILGICRGAAKTLLSVLSLIAAAAVSVFVSHFLSQLVFDTFIRQSLVDKINTAVTDSFVGDATLTAAAILAALPTFALSIMNYFGVSNSAIESYCADAITSKTDSISETIVDAIMPSVTGALSVVIGLILFVVLLIVFHWLSKLAEKIFKLPLLRTLDSLLGALVGLAEGIFAVFVIVALINLLLPLSFGEWVPQFESYMSNSYAVSLINSGKITSWIQLFIYNIEELSNI